MRGADTTITPSMLAVTNGSTNLCMSNPLLYVASEVVRRSAQDEDGRPDLHSSVTDCWICRPRPRWCRQRAPSGTVLCQHPDATTRFGYGSVTRSLCELAA